MREEKLLIVSGPSGAGKSSFCVELLKRVENIHFSISSTTRKPREGEQNGVHYDFLSDVEFVQGIANGVFLEWAKVHDNYYGTKKEPVLEALNAGKIVLFDIDVQGQKSLKNHFPNATSVFITTQSRAVLEERLSSRGLDSPLVISRRLDAAFKEVQSVEAFDFLIINDDFNAAFEGFLGIVRSLYFKNTPAKSAQLLDLWRDSGEAF